MTDSKMTYQVQLTVTVVPETDTLRFQPECYCATLEGTNWMWVGATPRDAAQSLVDYALRCGYRDNDDPGQPIYTIIEK